MAGSTALARAGELRVGKVLRAKQSHGVPLPVSPCTGFGGWDSTEGEAEVRWRCSVSPSPCFPWPGE